MLEVLQDYTEKDIPEHDIVAIVNAFFDIGDHLLLKCDEHRDMFDVGNDIRISRLIYQLLRRVDERSRFEIVSSAIEEGSAVAVIIHEIIVWGQEHGKFDSREPSPEEERIFTPDHLKTIERLALAKIIEAAEAGSLLSSPKLVGTLYAWSDLEGSDYGVRKWANDITATDDGLISFVEHFGSIIKSQSLGDLTFRKKYRLDPKLLEPFIDPNDIVERLTRIRDASQLGAEKMQAVSQFLHEYDLRMKGKNPDREGWED